MPLNGASEALVAVRRGVGRHARIVKVRPCNLTSGERATWQQQKARKRWLSTSLTRSRERRRNHPIMSHVLDAAVGLPVTAAVVALFLAYLGVV